MAFTQTQLEALESSYAEGVTKVVFNGRTVEYRSLKEMKAIISDMSNSISGTTATDKTYYPTFGRAY